MSVYLVVNNSDGLVSNAIEWDGGTSLNIPDVKIVPVPETPTGVWIGWTYINGEWISPSNNEIQDPSNSGTIPLPDTGE